jgi:hypothetical protein
MESPVRSAFHELEAGGSDVESEDLGAITTIQDVVGRARSRGLGCSRRAREHELSYRRWRFWSSLLGVLTAIGAAVAASTLLLADTGGARGVAAGLIALLAAAFATVNTSFLQTRVEENRAARAAFTNLRSRYYMLRDLPPKEIPAARAQLEDIERAHAQAEIESPPPEAWARQRRVTEEDRASAPPSDTRSIERPPIRPDARVSQTAAAPTTAAPTAAAPTSPRPAGAPAARTVPRSDSR